MLPISQWGVEQIQALEVALIGANIVLSLIILLYASWSDYKTREVSNRVWAIYAPIALATILNPPAAFCPIPTTPLRT